MRHPPARRLLFVVCLSLAAAGTVWLARRQLHPAEPTFEGRPLTLWLESHVPNSSANPPYGSPGWKKADQALRTIGTNAIPTLLEMLEATDPPAFLRKLTALAARSGWLRSSSRPASSRHSEARYAFEVLGTNAAAAVPDLIRIYQSNRSTSSRLAAAEALGSLRWTATSAVPVLVRDFGHTNGDVRHRVITSASAIGGLPDLLIPAFVGALSDPLVGNRWNALNGLMHFGGRARTALPSILPMLNDPSSVMSGTSITQQVVAALWQIAPEMIGQNAIVEDATPAVTDGVLTEDIKFQLQGRRQTLIKAGTRVPAVRQFWNSDPRPFLTVFRTATNAGSSDRLLGRFEVVDVPAEERVNVSTLCVVTERQILLCARDHTGSWPARTLAVRRLDPAAPPPE